MIDHLMTLLPRLDSNEPPAFPSTSDAIEAWQINGLLAYGGKLSPEWLLTAYRQGIFPWYQSGHPIMWWSPDPRCVLFTDQARLRRSLRKTMKKPQWRVRFDTRFREVINACANTPRRDIVGGREQWSTETWLSSRMRHVFFQLYRMGYAHSVEVYWEDELVGGLYGLQIGKMFFGESMFHRRTDASKIALVTLSRYLRRKGFPLIDCQVANPHLLHMGAMLIPREQFEHTLKKQLDEPFRPLSWRTETPPSPQDIAAGNV